MARGAIGWSSHESLAYPDLSGSAERRGSPASTASTRTRRGVMQRSWPSSGALVLKAAPHVFAWPAATNRARERGCQAPPVVGAAGRADHGPAPRRGRAAPHGRGGRMARGAAVVGVLRAGGLPGVGGRPSGPGAGPRCYRRFLTTRTDPSEVRRTRRAGFLELVSSIRHPGPVARLDSSELVASHPRT